MGSKTKLSYENDSYTVSVNGKDYICYVRAEAEYWYDPGCMYLRNGDPGYPSEDDLEITELEVSDFELDDDPEYVVSDEEKTKIKSAVEDELYGMDYDRWSSPELYDPECCEPDYF